MRELLVPLSALGGWRLVCRRFLLENLAATGTDGNGKKLPPTLCEPQHVPASTTAKPLRNAFVFASTHETCANSNPWSRSIFSIVILSPLPPLI
jgi:hypothetical protein